MTQVRRDAQYKVEFGKRLAGLVETIGMSWHDLSDELGYGNSTTLREAARGRTLLSAERLARLGLIRDKSGRQRVCLDWLLTGLGTPLVEDGEGGVLDELLERAGPVARAEVQAYLVIRTTVSERGIAPE